MPVAHADSRPSHEAKQRAVDELVGGQRGQAHDDERGEPRRDATAEERVRLGNARKGAQCHEQRDGRGTARKQRRAPGREPAAQRLVREKVDVEQGPHRAWPGAGAATSRRIS